MAEQVDKPRETKSVILSDQERQKADAWIKNHAKWGCPVCGNTHWRIYEEVVEMRPHYKDVFLGGRGIAYPAVLFLCTVCGYMMPFNAIAIGVMAKSESGSKKDA